MEVVFLVVQVYTDNLKKVQVANNPTILAKMDRDSNLPLFEYLLTLMSRNPGIKLNNVKTHGDFKKNEKRTRPQCSNYFADLISKNYATAFPDAHLSIFTLDHLHWSSLT